MWTLLSTRIRKNTEIANRMQRDWVGLSGKIKWNTRAKNTKLNLAIFLVKIG